MERVAANELKFQICRLAGLAFVETPFMQKMEGCVYWIFAEINTIRFRCGITVMFERGMRLIRMCNRMNESHVYSEWW